MFKTVTTDRGLEATLSSGSVMRVYDCSDDEGGQAWGAMVESVDGEKMQWGLSHEAFQKYVQLVAELYANQAGISSFKS